MVLLVLCDDTDTSALWVARSLRARGAEVLIATGSELECALRCEHAVDDEAVAIELALPGGRQFTGDMVTGVLDRLQYLPTPTTPGVSESDLQYAHQEFNALTLSWLAGLARAGCPFVGRPHASGLSGEWRYPSEWRLLAHAAGLAVAPLVLDSESTGEPEPATSWAIALCGEVFGDLPPEGRPGVQRLAAIVDSEALAVWFDARGKFIGADLLPDLRMTGARGLDAVAARLGVPVAQGVRR